MISERILEQCHKLISVNTSPSVRLTISSTNIGKFMLKNKKHLATTLIAALAAATLSGQFLGASDPDAAYKSGYQSAGMTMLAMSLSGLLLAFFAESIAWFFIKDEEVVKYAVIFVWIFALSQPFMALEFSLGSTLRGAGDTRSPLIITIIGLLLIRVPIAFLLFYLEMPVQWIFATLIFDYFAKGVLLILRYRSKRWMKVLKPSS